MITGKLKSQVDSLWNAFWSGGIANPLEVIEQITYLLFLRGLDERQTLAERKARATGKPLDKPIFPEGRDSIPILDDDGKPIEDGLPYEKMRWGYLQTADPAELYMIMDRHVFPFLRSLGDETSSLAKHMDKARFTIPTPQLLAKVVDLIAEIPMDNRDTKGDLYEYMLGKIASAGQNGQFRTPRHIIEMIVAMVAPTRDDVICDPACGTCGFLVAAGEYLRRNDSDLFTDQKAMKHFHDGMFHGHDFDGTMLRIGSMNMALHGVDGADVSYKDSLSEAVAGDEGAYSLILANPPFAGSLDRETTSKDLLRVVDTKKTELLFMALFLRQLEVGGRAAVIVPDGVLFGSSRAHKAIRQKLVEDQQLEGIVKLPSGVFKPYAGVSTAILFFRRTDSGGTDHVWFYDLQADGLSLDDKRNELLDTEKLGPYAEGLSEEEHQKNNLPDVLARWDEREGSERNRPRTAQSFCVPKDEIAEAGYDLSINRYKEVVHEEQEHRPPKDIIAELRAMEAGIAKGLDELEAML
jgi:type I restriction enzyme M protein